MSDEQVILSTLATLSGKFKKATHTAKLLVSRERGELHAANDSLVPLALAIIELTALCEKASSGDLPDLFRGDEDNGPNLDTRLRVTRDLCSAAKYCVRRKSETEGPKDDHLVNVSTTGERVWAAIITTNSVCKDRENILEVARLIDDIVESMLGITKHVHSLMLDESKGAWREVSRLLTQICEHFDSSELALINCMNPAR